MKAMLAVVPAVLGSPLAVLGHFSATTTIIYRCMFIARIRNPAKYL
jgi:hypothetical protein